MYCPKCDRTIPDEKLAEIHRQLVERFKKDDLAQGKCPVCGTTLIDLKKKQGK